MFLNKEIAKQAVALVVPSIMLAKTMGIGKRPHLHIVVVERPSAEMMGSCTFDQLILHEESIGEKKDWEFPFRDYALSKAYISWRTGLGSDVVQTQFPQILEVGDTIYGGSDVQGSVVTACSGDHGFIDRMYARWINQAIIGIATFNREKYVKDHPNEGLLKHH